MDEKDDLSESYTKGAPNSRDSYRVVGSVDTGALSPVGREGVGPEDSDFSQSGNTQRRGDPTPFAMWGVWTRA